MARSRPTDATDAQRRRILDAAEVVLRRHGPGKTSVVDVAREIGQTHASVYRYFASKAELVEALVARWLEGVEHPLAELARGTEGTAAARLLAWVAALHRVKVRKTTADPEVFAMFHAIAEAAPGVVDRHVAKLVAHVEAIIVAGVASGEFRVADPHRAARTILDATARFHHPALLAPPAAIPPAEDLEAAVALLAAGLAAGVL